MMISRLFSLARNSVADVAEVRKIALLTLIVMCEGNPGEIKVQALVTLEHENAGKGETSKIQD